MHTQNSLPVATIAMDTINSETELIDLYLHINAATPSLVSTAPKDALGLGLDSATGITIADVITMYDDKQIYQSLITAVSGNTISLASPLDNTFGISTEIHVGCWNLNKNGSTSPKIAAIHAPPNAIYDIHTIRFSMMDNATMDSATFGGINALSNGLLLRATNGKSKNTGIIVNNLGFAEIGFKLEYDSKAPSGYYGLRGEKQLLDTNGSILRIYGGNNSEFQAWIRDDLTALSNINITVSGRVVSNI